MKTKKAIEGQARRFQRYKADKKLVWVHADLDKVLTSGEYGKTRIEASKNLALQLNNKQRDGENHETI